MAGKTIVIVGGGIAGISCLEAIMSEQNVNDVLVLITDSRLIKRAKNYDIHTSLESCDIVTEDIQDFINSRTGLLAPKSILIVGSVLSLNVSEKKIFYSKPGSCYKFEQSYDVLCLCHGAKPIHLEYTHRSSKPDVDQRVIVLRDIDTVDKFREKLRNCRRLVIVGNGGISLELVHKVSECEKVWIIRDESIGRSFFDSGAAKFLLDSLSDAQTKPKNAGTSYSTDKADSENKALDYGPSLGPDWSQNSELTGGDSASNNLDIIYKDEVVDIVYEPKNKYPLSVLTKCNKKIECDLVVTGIGVEANYIPIFGNNLETSPADGGILIDEQMRTSVSGVYAAGDVVSCERWAHSEHWLQMRLWTQARQMGYYAGKCIINHLSGLDPSIYFQFDCFTHSTSFFGYKLILLGRYNGQTCDSGNNLNVIVRVNPGKEYIKVLIKDNRIYGSVLVGDTGKEDLLENLIRDGLRVNKAFEDCLLNDTIDIDDWYD